MKANPPIKFRLWSRPKNRIRRAFKLAIRRMDWWWGDFMMCDLIWLNLFAIIASFLLAFYCAVRICIKPEWWSAILLFINARTFSNALETEDRYKPCATTASDTKE